MFEASLFDAHATGCTCGGCSPLRPTLWAIHAGLAEYDPQLAVKVMKADGEDTEQDPFLSEETLLAAILAAAFALALSRTDPIVERMFRPPVTEAAILRGLDEMEDILGRVITTADERELRDTANRLIINGALDSDASSGGFRPATPASLSGNPVPAGAVVGVGTILENAPSAQQVMDGIVAAAKYYTNNYFNTFVIPEIQQRIRSILDGTPFNEVPGLADIRALLDRRLRSVPYWRLVANAAASRGYHYGYLKAAELRGVTTYRFVAVIDSRTSEICQFMNGKEFSVRNAVTLMERVAGAANIEEVKAIMPWRPFKEVDGLSRDALEALGVVVPPLHGNCRSTLVIV